MKKQILLATTLLALTGTASAAGSFTLQADDLQNGSFTRKQLLSALKVAELPGVTADSTPALVGFVAQAHALDASSITVMYGR